ncbi:MAG: tRNA preQ1(34) S-adenosylmethionine ribosyltransferase-isomerase QueA [Ruminococcaceae bacterium]|nr:tRNA preQ1(34) S-adenosylmethionine ribosyltransferase-isomerase QueA [Oscillospiraceae bacterium]
MERSQFNFFLPEELIAQEPATPRDSSKLLCLDKTSGDIVEKTFKDIEFLLNEGDVLVINDSKVIPARLLGEKEATGAAVELLLLNDRGNGNWECLAKPGKRLKRGAKVVFGGGVLRAEIVDEIEDGNRIAHFEYDHAKTFFEILDEVGKMPLPHYITKPLENNDDYQTVYANIAGSAAAPTAGLHFTEELLNRIAEKGVKIARITLHVGLGTFRPVKENDITKHLMHSEHYSVSKEAAKMINDAKAAGKRVIAVGTTSCRTLESVVKKHGEIVPCEEDTSIFIYPGYKFGAIDALITNFHLPESTLIMLVSAFAGYENTMNAYKFAVENKYRFFSFGDAMFIQ